MGDFMRTFVTATSVALLLGVTSAFAGDLGNGSLKDGAYGSMWDGLYFGASIGYGWGSSETYYNNDGEFYPDGDHPLASNDPSGGLAGLTVGYNHQFSDRWVAGVEGDLSIADISGDDHMYWGDGHYWYSGWNALFTLRGRVGYDLGGNLIYGTAGIATVDSNEYNIGDNANQSSDNTGWIWGWTAGIGVERQFTDRLSGKIEYLHVGMDDKSGYGDNGGAYEYENDLDLIRMGVNYKVR